MDKYNLSCLE